LPCWASTAGVLKATLKRGHQKEKEAKTKKDLPAFTKKGRPKRTTGEKGTSGGGRVKKKRSRTLPGVCQGMKTRRGRMKQNKSASVKPEKTSGELSAFGKIMARNRRK